MMLSGSKIKEELWKTIFIEPFCINRLNSNSYNLTLNNKLLVYNDAILDMKAKNSTSEIIIPEEGLVLEPNQLYLGSTVERTYSTKYIPRIEGRSSIARLGLFVHITAGLGEAGFDGCWTLELTCIKPIKIYPYTEICQIYYSEIDGDIDLCKSPKYQNSICVEGSKLYSEFKEDDL